MATKTYITKTHTLISLTLGMLFGVLGTQQAAATSLTPCAKHAYAHGHVHLAPGVVYRPKNHKIPGKHFYRERLHNKFSYQKHSRYFHNKHHARHHFRHHHNRHYNHTKFYKKPVRYGMYRRY